MNLLRLHLQPKPHSPSRQHPLHLLVPMSPHVVQVQARLQSWAILPLAVPIVIIGPKSAMNRNRLFASPRLRSRRAAAEPILFRPLVKKHLVLVLVFPFLASTSTRLPNATLLLLRPCHRPHLLLPQRSPAARGPRRSMSIRPSLSIRMPVLDRLTEEVARALFPPRSVLAVLLRCLFLADQHHRRTSFREIRRRVRSPCRHLWHRS
ncbi:hypothetical protein DENSPDRAFT_361917 [Dentipellis sp. KUC8613]|nr:hypothetical protein DENSPDRAFT_361917 [Dentipellis sp. KUC8613]